ncbi:DUF167 domain-containing protein [Desulfurococcaceae archaeon MEX13E-LK6-19]|nr:DUF167 domain-containing protein [Desulfurococcaceae archaeon MEX13E-LK6-19]
MEDSKLKAIYNSVQETSKGIVIQVFVKPESSKEELRVEGGELVYYTTEPPLQGRANAALIKFFAKTLGLPITKIDIVYGVRDRLKKILVKDIKLDEVVEKISEAVTEDK